MFCFHRKNFITASGHVPGNGTWFPGRRLQLQQGFDAGFDFHHVGGGLKAGDHIALPVDHELGEIPLDVRLLVPIGIRFREHFLQQCLVRMILETGKALLGFEIGVQRQLVFTIQKRLFCKSGVRCFPSCNKG